jgi:hypothetical protein
MVDVNVNEDNAPLSFPSNAESRNDEHRPLSD